jgi:hypothetical protein
MYRRGLALSVVALLGVLGGTGLSASAFASVSDIHLPSNVSVVAEISAVTAPAVAESVATSPAIIDTTDGVSDSSTPIPEEPVAEQSSVRETPVIMVTGLAVLLAAILMVVRSGSSRRLDSE